MLHTLSGLVISIAPLVLFSAVSPVVFLNANTAVQRGGQRGGWQFVLGNALVLLALGFACVGMLGGAATSFAEREIASRAVDRMLALALIGYGSYLAWTHRRSVQRAHDRAQQDAEDPAGGRGQADGLVAWGALGMATNFTSLPVYVSVSQRIGAADIHWAARIAVLLVASAVVLTPSWLPVVIARFNPRRSEVSAATRARIAHWTGLVSIGACFLGGIVLLVTSL